jgi:hypothetical protein
MRADYVSYPTIHSYLLANNLHLGAAKHLTIPSCRWKRNLTSVANDFQLWIAYPQRKSPSKWSAADGKESHLEGRRADMNG